MPKQKAFVQEFQRATPISLFQVWLFGHTRAHQILGLDMAKAERVYGLYKNGIVRGFTPPGNIATIKRAILTVGPRKIKPMLTAYVRNYRRLRARPALVHDQEFITELSAGFILAFISGDLQPSSLQKQALGARKSTEDIFPWIERQLHRSSQVKKDFTYLTYDEIVNHVHPSARQLKERHHRTIDSVGCQAVSRHQEPHVFKPVMNRSISLLLCQCWDAGERIMLPQKFGGSIFFDPMFVARRGKGVTVYYDYTDPQQDYDGFLKYVVAHKRLIARWSREYANQCRQIRRLTRPARPSDLAPLFQALQTVWPMIIFSNLFGSLMADGVPNWLATVAKKLRTEYDWLISETDAAFLKMAAKTAPKKYRPYIGVLTYEEIHDRAWPSVADLKRRQIGFIHHRGRLHPGTLAAYATKTNMVVAVDEAQKNSIVRGQVAQSGVATGPVRIIFERSQISAVQRGDIIIAPMTTPDFLPALKKAAAFVTDEGGVTCHAAIVARELKKPCIIGTRVATKVLKSGDQIEVDADRGVIRKVQ